MQIHWNKMSYPNKDGYDTEVILKIAKSRQFVGTHPFQVLAIPEGAPRIFGGKVGLAYLRDKPRLPERYVNGDLEHANYVTAENYLKTWPAVHHQFGEVMNIVHPVRDLTIESENARGSSSHAEEDKFGTMYTTYYDPISLAQAFVHEMAHNKLRAMGVFVQKANHLILNDSTKLYVSPVITHMKRPMTAVFHAQYSFMHITALNVAMMQAEKDLKQKAILAKYLSRNLKRMKQGHEEVKQYVELDENGQKFMDGFFEWSERVFQEADSLLQPA